MSGKVGNKIMEILQHSRCTKVIAKEELMDEADFTGIVGQ